MLEDNTGSLANKTSLDSSTWYRFTTPLCYTNDDESDAIFHQCCFMTLSCKTSIGKPTTNFSYIHLICYVYWPECPQE